jgi:hypothetical protein
MLLLSMKMCTEGYLRCRKSILVLKMVNWPRNLWTASLWSPIPMLMFSPVAKAFSGHLLSDYLDQTGCFLQDPLRTDEFTFSEKSQPEKFQNKPWNEKFRKFRCRACWT